MRYLSVCSGIEAATVAWHPLGWKPVAFAEIDAFPSAVLAHHYPDVPNVGDFTKIDGDDLGAVDLLVGGTPCQDFSIAGLRAGLGGERGALTLEFLRLLDRIRPRWMVWENVPGVLSADGGRAFGAFLGGLAELGYGWAYRVLDAQFFGVPQRRRRVFVVGCLGDARRAAAVLFEHASLSGHPAPRRQAGAIASALTRDGLGGGGPDDNLAHGMDLSQKAEGIGMMEECAPTLASGTHPGHGLHVLTRSAVRRLTPRECERLQGFPDDYTLVPYRGKAASDGPRYRALGNSMAVPVMRFIGERIAMVDAIADASSDAA